MRRKPQPDNIITHSSILRQVRIFFIFSNIFSLIAASESRSAKRSTDVLFALDKSRVFGYNLSDTVLRNAKGERTCMASYDMPTMYFFSDFDHLSGISVNENRFSAFKSHRHDFYEFECVTHGSCTYILNNESYTVGKGDILFVTPLDSHAYRENGGEDIRTVTVHFELSTPIPYTTMDAGIVRKNPLLFDCFMHLIEEYAGCGAYKEEALKNLLERILILYMRANSLTATPLPSDITYAVGYVHKHYFDTLTLSKISELCGYSQGYFCRKFKQYTRYSFVAYLNHVRLLNAARLLCDAEDLPVYRIAESCGFSCIRQFNREFLKKFGCAPSLYRKRSK